MRKTRRSLFALFLLFCSPAAGGADSVIIHNHCRVPVTVVGYVTHCEIWYPGGYCSSPTPACGNFDPLAPDAPVYNPGWRCPAPIAECRGTAEAGGTATGAGCSDCITRVEAFYQKADGTQQRDRKESSDLWACWFTGRYDVRIVQADPNGPVCDIQ